MNESPLLRLITAWAKDASSLKGGEVYQYRFVLSGCAYNGDLEGDYTKATFGGLLLAEPFSLWKIGHSYDDYPQELAAWINVFAVTETQKNITSTDTPHAFAADEIAAVLTLYLRRLVTVAGAVAVTVPEPYSRSPLPKEHPMPILLASRGARTWPRLPLTVIYGPSGVSYIDHNAEDVPVSPSGFRDFLLAISRHPNAARIINAAQLYHCAMENLFSHPDVSYLLFVCAAEAVASAKPGKRTEQEVLTSKAATSVFAAAVRLGMSEADAKALALASVPDTTKSLRQMFSEFLASYGKGHEQQAPLFNREMLDLFKVTDESAAIAQAYNARSGYVHAARPYESSALVGMSTAVPVSAFFDVMIENEKAPSILWFERIVSRSIHAYCVSAVVAAQSKE